MDTWGISGPRFLLLYLALLAVTVAGVVLARRRALAAPAGAAVPARLDRYEAAYLNGGCELVATTAVVRPAPGRRPGQPGQPRPAASGWARGRPRRPGPTRSSGPPTSWSPTAPTTRAGPWGPSCAGRRPWPPSASGCARPAWPPPPSSGPATGRPGCGSCPCSPWERPGSPPGRPTAARSGSWSCCWSSPWCLAVALCLRVPNATELGRRTLDRLRAETGRPAGGASPAELAMATALFGAGVLWSADVEMALALRLPREHERLPGRRGGADGGGGGGSCGGGGGCGGCGGGCGG